MLSVNLRIDDKLLYARLKGELDESYARSLKDNLCKVIVDYDICNIIFNLEELTFMDSSGIGVILGRFQQLKVKNGCVILCNINDHLEKIIGLSGIKRLIHIIDNEINAKKNLEEKNG